LSDNRLDKQNGRFQLFDVETPFARLPRWNLTGDKSNKRIWDSLSGLSIFWEKGGTRLHTS